MKRRRRTPRWTLPSSRTRAFPLFFSFFSTMWDYLERARFGEDEGEKAPLNVGPGFEGERFAVFKGRGGWKR